MAVQPIPEVLEHLIALNVEFQVLVCTSPECQYAVSPVAISGHLFRKHQVKIELRKQVEQYVQLFPHLYNHVTIQLPENGSIPQPIIPVVNGFQCRKCPFKSQNRKAIREHGNKTHGKQREADQDIFTVARMQTWFRNGKERYWTVDEDVQAIPARNNTVRDVGEQSPVPRANLDGDEDGGDGNQFTVSYDRLESDIQRWKEEKQERRLTLLARPAAVELDPWVRYTKWHEVLEKSKHNLIQTYAYLREPDPEEINLQRIIRSWKVILERCLNTLESVDHRDVLKWWESPRNEIASQRPFELPQNSKSLEKYSKVFEQFICYMIRTMPEEFNNESETGVVYTDQQWESIKRIKEAVSIPQPGEDNQDEELTNELMHLLQLVLMQDTSRIPLYNSPFMHYLAVRGIDVHTKGFRSSFFYTPIYP